MNKIAIIGGSRFTSLENFVTTHCTTVNTPYGEPSAPLSYGLLGEREVVFLPRRGSEAPMPPHKINYRANIWALRDSGVQTVIATAAVTGIGDLYPIGALVVPDQLIDYTYGRDNTFFGDDQAVSHIDFTYPYSESLRKIILNQAQSMGVEIHAGSTYGILQGPRYETYAEGMRLLHDGCHLIGMTGMPEATLARELGLDYALIAIVTRSTHSTKGTSNNSQKADEEVCQGEKQLADLIEQILRDPTN